MELLNLASDYLMKFTMTVLGITALLALIRAMLGPRFTDRIVAVNMVGTMTILLISILALHLNEPGLLDVALIYALLSFLAVVVLTNIYRSVYRQEKAEEQKENSREEEQK